jgi:hypothetical protein
MDILVSRADASDIVVFQQCKTAPRTSDDTDLQVLVVLSIEK